MNLFCNISVTFSNKKITAVSRRKYTAGRVSSSHKVLLKSSNSPNKLHRCSTWVHVKIDTEIHLNRQMRITWSLLLLKLLRYRSFTHKMSLNVVISQMKTINSVNITELNEKKITLHCDNSKCRFYARDICIFSMYVKFPPPCRFDFFQTHCKQFF